MNSEQNPRPNGDQAPIRQPRAGISPTTEAATQAAAANRQHADHDSGPMTQSRPDQVDDDSGDGQNPAPDT